MRAAFLVLACASCSEAPVSQALMLKARGLFTNPNLIDAPEGALVVADNVIIRRPGIWEPRRGVSSYGSASHVAKRMTIYNSTLITHSSTGTISYDNGSGTFTAVSGSYPPPNTTTAKTRFAQASQDLFFTTSAGVYRMDSATATPGLAGGIKSFGFERDGRVYTANAGSMSLTSNVVSVTTTAAHGFYVGQVITQTSATEAPYAAGSYTVASVPSSTSFTYALVAGDDAANANPHTFAPAALVTAGGFLSDGNQVAYRAVFNCPDANNTEKPGAASPRLVVANASGTVGWVTTEAKNVVVRVFVPSEATTSFSVRLYRSAQVSTSVEPSDEMQLVYETLLKSTDISRGWIDITDITPDSIRGEAGYFAPSREGILQNNERPPIAKDLVSFGGSMHYANTTGLQRMVINLLGVGSPNGVQDGENFYFFGGGTALVFKTTPTASTHVKLETSGSASQNIRNTALNLCAAINRDLNQTAYAFYISGQDDAPGKILLERRTLGATALIPTLATDPATSVHRAAWAPLMNSTEVVNLSRTGTTVTATTTSGTNVSFLVGESVTLITGNADFPAGAKTVVTVSGTTFTYTESGAATTLASQGFYQTSRFTSTAETAPNRIYHSKTNQHEAVPLLNYNDVGRKDAALLRHVATRSSMFAFKEDGLFRGSGANGVFSWELFDPTIILLAPDSVVVLGNQIYALTTQGVVAISDTGSEVVSRDIEKTLIDLQAVSLSKLQQLTFGVARESDRVYELRTITSSGDSQPTQAFLFHAAEDIRGWTRDTLSAWCGIQNPVDDKRYLGGTSFVLKERKDFVYSDYADEDLSVTINSKDQTASTVTLASASGVAAGDILTKIVSARITAVNGNVLTIAPEDTILIFFMTTGAATVRKAFTSTMQWPPATAGNAGALKLWRENTFLLGNAHFPAATISHSTELVTSFESTSVDAAATIGQWVTAGAPWDATERPFNLRVPVPQERRRAARLNLKWAITSAWAVWNLSGLGLTYNEGSDRVAR